MLMILKARHKETTIVKLMFHILDEDSEVDGGREETLFLIRPDILRTFSTLHAVVNHCLQH